MQSGSQGAQQLRCRSEPTLPGDQNDEYNNSQSLTAALATLFPCLLIYLVDKKECSVEESEDREDCDVAESCRRRGFSWTGRR
jgi:hypothetical protein